MRAKVVLVLVATVSLAGGLMQPVHAAKPSRTCSSPFSGPFTFQYLTDNYPVPAGVDLAGIDHNGDGLLCVKTVDSKTPAALNIADNTALKK
jgi:hypothetical protein